MVFKNIKNQLQETQSALNDFSIYINGRKEIERLHRDNLFNRRFSAMLSSYSDFETVALRLERMIAQNQILERQIQYEMRGKKNIPDELQPLMKDAHRMNKENQVDFKGLYIFAKIFLDEFTSLVGFMHNWRGISTRSVTSLYKALEKYVDRDKKIITFKNKCFNRLKAVNVFITQYRDNYIVHDKTEHKETRWFLNDMQGGVQIIGGRASITPVQLVFVVARYVMDTIDYTSAHL